jgi:hypothetical protein
MIHRHKKRKQKHRSRRKVCQGQKGYFGLLFFILSKKYRKIPFFLKNGGEKWERAAGEGGWINKNDPKYPFCRTLEFVTRDFISARIFVTADHLADAKYPYCPGDTRELLIWRGE